MRIDDCERAGCKLARVSHLDLARSITIICGILNLLIHRTYTYIHTYIHTYTMVHILL
jgi:hypothetical protein